MGLRFDHLVIGAADLDQGAAWAALTLGARPPIGGAHAAMGTHNRLARLASGYLEIIAIDPVAPAPGRKRWYGLDDRAQKLLLDDRPRPIGFVMAVDDLDAAVAACAWDAGEILSVSRSELSWRMAVRPDGAVTESVLPLLIEWPESLGRAAPTDQMADFGLALRTLRLKHPEPRRIRELLASLQVEEAMVEAGAPLEIIEAQEASLEAMIAPDRIDARR